MNGFIIVAIVVIMLSLSIYLLRRRFGLMALALLAGALIASLWTIEVTTTLRAYGIQTGVAPLEAIVSIALTFSLPLLALMSPLKYAKKHEHLLSAVLFLALAVAVGVQLVIRYGLVPDSLLLTITTVDEQSRTLITAAAVVAIFDFLTIKSPKTGGDDKKKH
ncbi:hypothetical protein FJZ39_03500 [Candidatus Saccharibacteria bacterium]|nr:hypothetical protein [Candidatus Saccharibacteria bacterium]